MASGSGIESIGEHPTQKTFVGTVDRQIADRYTTISAALTSGAAKDYAEYRFLCGQLQGLVFARQEMTDLVRKLQRKDEDE